MLEHELPLPILNNEGDIQGELSRALIADILTAQLDTEDENNEALAKNKTTKVSI